jgi:hypothetical protein
MYSNCVSTGNPITFPDAGECNVNGYFLRAVVGTGGGGFGDADGGLLRKFLL